MAILTKDEIRDIKDITEKVVSVPEWGGEVKVRSITQRQMNQIKNSAKQASENDESIDEDTVNWNIFKEGVVEPAFDDDDRAWLMEKSSSAFMRVLKEILLSSKLNDKALKVEEKQFRS